MFQSTTSKKASSYNRKSNSRRATLEQLERREVFATAVTAFVQQGSLFVNGTDGHDNIEIRFANNQIEVPGVMIKNAQGQLVSQLSRSVVSGKVVANGLLGNDRIAVVESGNAALPVVLNGNEGNDTLVGGSANDQLFGGGGNDVLSGGRGVDQIDGGAGSDRIREVGLYDGKVTGQELVLAYQPAVFDFDIGDITWNHVTDRIIGIESVDLAAQASAADGVVLDASQFPGSAILRGSNAADYLIGGRGDDQLFGNGGNDLLSGGLGVDRIDGGTGSDRIREAGLYDGKVTGQELVLAYQPAVFDFDIGDVTWNHVTESFISIESVDLAAQASAVEGVVLDASQFPGSAILRGSNAADYLIGGRGDDQLFGNGGNDLLSGGLGADRIDGGTGSDRTREVGLYDGKVTGQQLVLAYQPAVIDFDIGDITWKHVTDNLINMESVELSAQASAVEGVVLDASQFPGVAILRGSSGHDRLLGGAGDDMLYGGSGNDYIAGAAGKDTIFGEFGDDILLGDLGNDLIDGGQGFDQLVESSLSNARLTDSALTAERTNKAGIETDSLKGVETSTLTGGVGTTGTTLLDASGFSGPVTLVGTAGRDTLIGGKGDDKLFGMAGDDILTGNIGNDLIDGGTGMDTVSESQLVNAEITYTRLTSSGKLTSVSTQAAGLQSDFLKNLDAAELSAGENSLGMTVLNASNFNGNVKLFGTSGKDYLTGGVGNDILMGYGGDDVLIGNAGNDSLWGGIGNDEILGGAGNDMLQGGNGSDFLDGEEGNDFVMGGPDNDRLISGTGADTIDGGEGVNLFVAKAVDTTRQLNTLSQNSMGVDIGVKVPTNTSDNTSNDSKDEATWKQVVKVLGAELKTYESWKSIIERLDRGERVSASEIGGQIAVSITIAVNKIFPATQPFAKLMEDVARRRGQYYGDMFSDVADILKGQEKGSVAETVAKLAAAAISVYAFDSAKFDLVRYLGANGWEAFKSVAVDIARGEVEQAVKDIAAAAGELIDEIKKQPKDVWNGLEEVFKAIF